MSSRRSGRLSSRDARAHEEATRILGIDASGRKILKKTRADVGDLPASLQRGRQPERDDLASISILKDTGILHVYDRVEDSIPFTLQVIPLAEMSAEKLEKVQYLAHYFARVANSGAAVKTNGSQLAAQALGHTTGNMYAVGWRKAMVPGEQYGTYAPGARADAESQAEYAALYQDLPTVAAIYQEIFEELAPGQVLENRVVFDDAELLASISELKLGTRHEIAGFMPASNLTVTNKDFNNVLHKDNDSSPFSFGLWLNTRKDGTLIMDGAEIESAITGGEFVVPEYGVGVDFKHPALYALIWRGRQDLHCTLRSTTVSNDFSRFGSSVQVNTRLFKAAQAATDVSNIVDLASRMETWQFSQD